MLLLLLTECERLSWNDRYQSWFRFTTSSAPNSTDLNLLDYKIWGEMQQQVYQVHDINKLKQQALDQCLAWFSLMTQVISDADVSVWVFM